MSMCINFIAKLNDEKLFNDYTTSTIGNCNDTSDITTISTSSTILLTIQNIIILT